MSMGYPQDVKGRKPNIITSLELDPAVMEQRNLHLQAKYAEITAHETRYEEIDCEDAEYLIVAFGSCARIAQKINGARPRGRHQSWLVPPHHLVAVPWRSPKGKSTANERHPRRRN